MKAPIRWFLAAVVAALPSIGLTQTFPNRPIRLISPNPAGGANDTVARLVSARLADLLSVQIVIDNRGGAGGLIGAELAARATPDGHTLLAGSVSTHSFAPVIHRKLPYDPVGDFAAVSLMAIVQNLLVVHPGVPAHSPRELVALAGNRPGALNYSSGGAGSTSHFAVALFVSVTGIGRSTTHVPYKGGAPALAAAIAGEAQFYFGPMAGMMPVVKAGRVRALAVGGARRSATAPDIPTLAESGFPAYRSAGWFGLMAPSRTPAWIVARLSRAVQEAVREPDVYSRLLAQGIEPAASSPEEFTRFIAEQLAVHRKVVADENLRFE